MTKTHTILTLSFICCMAVFGHAEHKNQIPTSRINAVLFDSATIAILPFDSNAFRIFEEGKATDLVDADFATIDSLLAQCMNDYNPGQEKQFEDIDKQHPEYKLDKQNFVIDLARYKRQYMAIENAKGEKEVWVNCFCEINSSNWKKYPIRVSDGGNCYFQLKINLTTKTYYEFMVNGDA